MKEEERAPVLTSERMSGSAFQGDEGKKRSSKILDTVVSISLYALFFGVPLFFLNLTFQGMLFEKQMYFYFCLLIGLIAWTVQGVTTGALRIRRTPFDIPLLILWAVAGISTLLSPDIWRSFVGAFIDPSRGFLSLTAMILAYFFVLSNATPKRLWGMFWALVMAGGIVILLTILAVLNLGVLPGWFPVSLMGSITAMGIFVASVIPLFVTGIFFISQKRTIRARVIQVLLWIALLLNLFLLLVLYGYVPWIAILLGIGAYLLFILSQIIRPDERLTWVPMVIFVAVLIILMIGRNQIAQIPLPQEVYPGYGLSWEVAQKALSENTFFGTGPATYQYAFSKYAPDSFWQSWAFQFRFENGTGLFFESLTTSGIIGAIFFAFFCVMILVVSVYFLSRDKQKNKLFSLGVWSAFIISALSSLLTVAHGSILIVTALLGALATAVLLLESEREDKFLNLSVQASPRFALAMSFVSLILMVGVAFIFVLMGRAFVADVYAGIGSRQSDVSIDVGGSIDYFNRARNLYPREGYYPIRIGRELLTLGNREALKPLDERDENLASTYLTQAITIANVGNQLLPISAIARENVALIYDGAAFYIPDLSDDAKAQYEAILELEPRNPNVYVKLGQLELGQSRVVEAEEERERLVESSKNYFKQALEIRPNYPVAYYQLALAEDSIGNVDEAIANMNNAVSLAGGVRGSLPYAFALAQLYQQRNAEGDRDLAGDIYEAILSVDDKEINTLLNQGLLFERDGNREAAISSYERVKELLPEEGADQAKEQLDTFIQNLREGRDNLTPNDVPIPGETQSTPAVDTTTGVTTVETQEQINTTSQTEGETPQETSSQEANGGIEQ